MSESELLIPPDRRLNFLTLHLADLQSVRVLPLFATVAMLPLADRVWQSSARVLSIGTYALLVLLFVWFRVVSRYLRDRFGSSRPMFAKDGPLRRGMAPAIFLALAVMGVSIYCILRGGMQPLTFVALLGDIMMARQVLDSTNPGIRRAVYGVALGLSVGVPVAALHNDFYVTASAIAWCGLAVFDCGLLFRTAGRKAAYA